MKRHGLPVAALGAWLALAAPLYTQEANWRIDPVHSAAHFSVRHLMISTVRGSFGGITGSLYFDPSRPTHASVEAAIDTRTINTGESKRDADLKGEEFFDVTRYPVMTFRSKRVDRAGTRRLRVTGELTIKGTTREIVLMIEGPTSPIIDPRGNEKIGATASTKINRKDFGITWNQLLETGGVAVSDEVSITLDIELVRKKN